METPRLGAPLVYGAYGYTGRLVVERAMAEGLRPVLAGRDARKLEELARRTGLEFRAYPLEPVSSAEEGLAGVDAALHCAGPFSRTALPMAHACLRRGVDYLDVTGEIGAFDDLAELDGPARDAGIALLPGVGFDVVPTDCLAAHLKRRLPSATRLTLAFYSRGGVSRGTARTAVERLGRPGQVVRDGKRVPLSPLGRRRRVDFGDGPRVAVAIPWGDLATAPRSTGIQNVEVYAALSGRARVALKAAMLFGFALRVPPIRAALRAAARAWIRGRPPGPDAETRARGETRVWGEVRDEAGGRAAARLYGPEGYTFTARAAVAALLRTLSGEAGSGFLTPSLAFGPDFVLEVEGVRREDEDERIG